MTLALVTIQEYRDITKDLNTAAEEVSARLEESQELVEEYLKRKLSFGTYTEDLEVWFGDGTSYAYPSVTPVVSVPADSSYIVDFGSVRFLSVTDVLTGVFWWDTVGLVGGDYGRTRFATVTYDGGYTNETCPRTLKRAIARGARSLIAMDVQRLVGATHITVGDVSVDYGKFTGDLEALVPGISLALRPYRRKQLR